MSSVFQKMYDQASKAVLEAEYSKNKRFALHDTLKYELKVLEHDHDVKRQTLIGSLDELRLRVIPGDQFDAERFQSHLEEIFSKRNWSPSFYRITPTSKSYEYKVNY